MSYSNGLRGLLLAAFTTLAGCATTSRVDQDIQAFQQQQAEVMDLGLEGNHRFTVLATPDSYESNVFALQLLLANLEKVEKSGAKHIMLQTHDFPRLVPDGMPFDAQRSGESREDFLKRASKRLDDLTAQAEALRGVKSFGDLQKVTGNEQAAKVVDLVKEMAKDGISYGPEFYRSLTASLKAETQKFKDVIERLKPLEAFYADPSDENKQKLRDLSHFVFQANNTGHEGDNSEYARLLAEVIIQAQEKGIEVHLEGDKIGAPGTVQDAQNTFKGHIGEFSKFIEDNPDLTVHLKALAQLEGVMGIDGYLRTLNLDEEKHKDLKERLEKFKLLESGDAKDKPGALTERFSEDAEEARAKKFLELADGERAVIVWDPAHFLKAPNNASALPHGKDINEFINDALALEHVQAQAEALANGSEAPAAFEPTRVVEVYKSDAGYELVIEGYGDLYTDRPDARYFGDERKFVVEPQEPKPEEPSPQ